MANHRFSPDWRGETGFIIAGGSSVKGQPIERLKGQRVIVINSSYQIAPFADYLIFSDERWWTNNKGKLGEFSGRVICAWERLIDPAILKVGRRKPPGLSRDPSVVTVNWTTLTAAIDVMAHLGVLRIVLLGADMKRGPNGECHHHKPHPWKLLDINFPKQIEDLKSLVAPLKQRGIEVINCSPGTSLPFWPVMNLSDVLDAEQRAA